MISRKMRIAADIAHGWARNFKLGDALAKSVLTATTLYVNDQGSCFVGISTLADDTELSQNTVRRKLMWLEEIHAIKRVPQWLDAHGRRTSDRQQGGKCTSDEIKLCLEIDPAEIEARARGEFAAPPDTASPLTADQFSPPSVGGLNPVSPPLALQQPSQCWEGLNLLNGEREERERDTRPREPATLVSAEAFEAMEECFRSIGHRPGDLLNLSGLHYEIQVWITAGHKPAAIVGAFVQIAATYGNDKPLSYFVKAMNTALANRNLPPDAAPRAASGFSRERNGAAHNAGFIHNARRLAEQAADD